MTILYVVFFFLLIDDIDSDIVVSLYTGADPGFQVGGGGGGGAHLKKLHRAEGGVKNFGVFRVKNHDFTPKNHIFPILGGGGEGCTKFLGYFM